MEEPERRDAGEALAGFGIATAVRDVAVSVGIVLGLVYLLPLLHRHSQHAATVTVRLKLPASAGLRTLPASAGPSTLPAGPWVGLGLLAAGAVVVLLVGGLLIRLRDA